MKVTIATLSANCSLHADTPACLISESGTRGANLFETFYGTSKKPPPMLY